MKFKYKFTVIIMFLIIAFAAFIAVQNKYPYREITVKVLLSLYGLHLFIGYLSKTKIYLFHTVVNEEDSVGLRLLCAAVGFILYFYFIVELINYKLIK